MHGGIKYIYKMNINVLRELMIMCDQGTDTESASDVNRHCLLGMGSGVGQM